MATTIKLKSGSGAPLAGDLVAAEPALDLTNKRLYTEDSGGTVIEVGTNPTSLTTGTFTSTGIDDNATSTAITIDSSENVGIGTVSPGAKFDVKGSARIERDGSSTLLQFTDTGVSSRWIGMVDGTSRFAIYGTNGSTEEFVIDSSGNVGIGTASPQHNLSVVSSGGTATISFKDSGTSDQGRIRIRSQSEKLEFITGGGVSQTIDSSGNVGIGTSDPSSFSIDTGPDIILGDGTDNPHLSIVSPTTGTGYVAFADGTAGTAKYSGLIEYAHSTDHMGLRTGGTERMRIDSSGSLLVGTTDDTPVSPGTASGASIRSGGQIQASSSSDSPLYLNRFTTTGKLVGIRYAGVDVGSIDVTASATSYVTSSDARLKENIVDAPAGNIDAIRVRSFDWKADGTHQTYGMVAQELVDVAPEAVAQGETEDDMWGVDYSKLVPMMIKEIQDLKAEVAALKGA